MVAIRQACRALGTFQLSGCELFTSCEPCPMCLGAVYWARLDRVWYATTRVDAAAIGFDDEHFYGEMSLPLGERRMPFVQLLRDEAHAAFKHWHGRSDRKTY
jgi:tRNA(Arg) A34 adenosine deaminase TadA